MVERRHTRDVGADLEYHVMPGSCIVKNGRCWQRFLLDPSTRAGSAHSVLKTVGTALKWDLYSCGAGKHGPLVGLLSRLLRRVSVLRTEIVSVPTSCSLMLLVGRGESAYRLDGERDIPLVPRLTI